MKSKTVFIIVALAVLLVVGVGWSVWRSPQASRESKGTGAAPPVPVTVAKAVVRKVPIVISVIGRAEAIASVAVKSRVDGQITSIEFKEGQPVKKGQVLVRLDPANFAAGLRQVEATREKGQAQLQKLRDDLERNRNLAKQGFISAAQLNQTQAELLAAEASTRADVAAGDNAKLSLSYTTIRAPMDGMAGVMQVHPGSTVKANDTALLIINQIHPIHASFSVPEARLAQLRAATAKGPIQVSAEVPGSKFPIKGQVAVIDNAVDVSTGTILVKAVFPNENNLLTPGQFVNISLVIDQLDNALVVPSAAVQIGPNGNFVFVVKADQTVVIRPVSVGLSLGEATVLSSGVSPGETVVTDGQSRLKAGVKVELFAQPDRLSPTSSTSETAPSDDVRTVAKSPAAP